MRKGNYHNIPILNYTSYVFFCAMLMLGGFTASGQDTDVLPPQEEIVQQKKDKLVKISGSMQFWLRHTSLNPGSMVLNEEKNSFTDISIRRYRLKFSGNASDKLKYTVEFGNNDLNFYSGDKSYPHLLDAFVDYQFSSFLAIGAGKQPWSGLTRYAVPATTQALAYDIDFIAAPFVNVYDDILRRMGVYARGAFKGLDYRFALAKPSHFNNGSTPIGPNAKFSDREPDYQFSGYVKYQFLEHETQASPYSAGTYLGKKNILNLGVGMLQQPNTTWHLNADDTVYHTARSLAADLFFEKSLPKNRGITCYLALVQHDMGKNFMRYMGANNPATAGTPTPYVNGKGNNAPVIGTGHILYLQAAYVRPADAHNETQLQPYASLQYNSFEALDEPVIIYNAGFNYYLNGQRSKLTFGYQNRPVFKQEEHIVKEGLRKSMLVAQYQILFGG